jgi:hypothetical protein
MGNNPILSNDILGDVAKPVAGEKSGLNNKKAWNTYIQRVKGKDQVRVLAPDGKYHTFSSKQFSFTYSDGKESEDQIKKEGVWQIKNKDGHFMWDNVQGKYVKNTSGIEPGQNSIPEPLKFSSLKGTTYAGGDNPKDYSQPAQNSADQAGRIHDINYDGSKISGGDGVFDFRSSMYNYQIILDSKQVVSDYHNKKIDPYTGAVTSKATLKYAESMIRSFSQVEDIKTTVKPYHPIGSFIAVPSFNPSINF